MLDEEDWRSALTWMILPVGRTWYRAVSKAFEDFGMSFSSAAPILAIAAIYILRDVNKRGNAA